MLLFYFLYILRPHHSATNIPAQLFVLKSLNILSMKGQFLSQKTNGEQKKDEIHSFSSNVQQAGQGN